MVGQELLSSYDILLVDLYGVIWSGTYLFPAALDTLGKLMSMGKKVVILSNISFVSKTVTKEYESRGLLAEVHFFDFVTSGNAFRDILVNHKLYFRTVKFPKKYFVYGTENAAAFAGTDFEKTYDLDEADFVYLSAVQFSDDERNRMSDTMKQCLYVTGTSGNDKLWESTSVEPFIPTLQCFLDKKKPIVIANPDKIALCAVLETPNAREYTSKPIVKQGLLARTYESMGGEVFAVGKPYPQIYRYTLENLAMAMGISLEDICKKRIAMVGDSLETDILGAKNASKDMGCSIDSILVLSGISARDIARTYGKISSEIVNKFFSQEKLTPTHLMSTLDMGAEVYF
ncbi:MAG: HAD hydrolase-like protein [Puniceicoccales bacterium]|jgi:HAD superfamily hydrolase (TIGR01450 family)|nr:HAD hydrolase-like protein [Puniceicoccales bacterium]